MIERIFKILVCFTLVFLIPTQVSYAQNVLDDIEEEDRVESSSPETAPNLVTETVKVISPSKKIFIITNENKSFSKGDFISLLLSNKLVCRALVAKTTDNGLSGIKIIKIYNVTLWKQLKINKDVLVLKGDDSYYSNLEKAPKDSEENKPANKIQDEDDLFNSSTLNDDDLSLEESNKRLIKTDNLLSAGLGLISGKDESGTSTRYSHLNASWGYQITDNIWAELGIGTNTVKDYPTTGLDTRLLNYMTKVKYTFSAPFYSYIMPYVGYQVIQAESPGAGVNDGKLEGSPEEIKIKLDNEILAVDDLKKSSIIFGVTVLKRIVPGWFIRADLGSDILNGGLTLEF